MVYEIKTPSGDSILFLNEDYFCDADLKLLVNFMNEQWHQRKDHYYYSIEEGIKYPNATAGDGRDGPEVDHNEGRPTTKDMAGESKFTVGTHHSTPAILYRGVVVQFLDIDRIAELCDNIDEHLK